MLRSNGLQKLVLTGLTIDGCMTSRVTSGVPACRVGVIGDGKCLLHSLMFLLHDDYLSMALGISFSNF